MCTHHAPQHTPQSLWKEPCPDPTLSERNRSTFDPLDPPSLSISSGQSLHFESLSRSSRWQSRRETEMRGGKEGSGGEQVLIQKAGEVVVQARQVE